MIKFALIKFITPTASSAGADGGVFGQLSPPESGTKYVTVVGSPGDSDPKYLSGTESGLAQQDFEISVFVDGKTREGDVLAVSIAESIATALRNYVGFMTDPASPNIRHRVAGVRVGQPSDFFDDEAELYECSFFVTLTFHRS